MMVDCEFFYNALLDQGVEYFAGVPDSLLKNFCGYVADNAPLDRHIIAANEGAAVALACGNYLATGRTGLVYLQNSGQGNTVNPLLSLADSGVYSVPMIVMIGWRGEPGKHDEPQHLKQGKVTISMLEAMEVPYRVLPSDDEEAAVCLQELVALSNEKKCPVALVVSKGTFGPYTMRESNVLEPELTRYDAIQAVANCLEEADAIVSTTGKISRELYTCREKAGETLGRDFLNVGAMGHCSQIALGVAMAKPDKQVYCFDGDGAIIMHMGALAIIGSCKPKNFKHIVFNNGCHDSVGGQPTCGRDISFLGIAESCGYKWTNQAKSIDEIKDKMEMIRSIEGPAMLEVVVRKGASDDLGRPKASFQESKAVFMELLNQ